jgi:hypothetical protein
MKYEDCESRSGKQVSMHTICLTNIENFSNLKTEAVAIEQKRKIKHLSVTMSKTAPNVDAVFHHK